MIYFLLRFGKVIILKYENVKIFRGIEIDTIVIIQNFIFPFACMPDYAKVSMDKPIPGLLTLVEK